MQAVPRLRRLLNPINSGSLEASFHSTSVCDDKRKKKWAPYRSQQQQQQPAKEHIRFVTRQKRADAKKALKSLLFHGVPFGSASQEEDRPRKKKEKKESWDTEVEDDTNSFSNTGRSETRRSQRIRSKQRRKQRRGYLTEEEEQNETTFQARFGNRWYSWSFFHPFPSSQFFEATQARAGFDWRENLHNGNDRRKRFEAESDIDSDDEVEKAGSHSDRTTLGLPPHGPLKIEDVKSAFRLSALKWHPDKHQGPSQAQAEEKFKLCVTAYKSLCNSLSAA